MLGSILIVGGGTAGWMTAAALSHHLRGTPISIRLVESEAIGTVGVGEATIPPIRNFNIALGIDEAEFFRETKATVKLGIEFINWARKGDHYIHPFDIYSNFSFPDLHHLYAAGGSEDNMDDYSFGIAMAHAGKFALPGSPEAPENSHYDYAYQFDASLYAAYLRRFSEARGVSRIEGKIRDVHKDADGYVSAVELEDGTRLEADLFVDCSGFRSLLVGQALGSEHESWEEWLPCDRAIAMPCASDGPPIPYTKAEASEAGWIWHIPLQHRIGNGHVFSSQYMDEGLAEELLRASLSAEPIGEPNLLRFKAGMRRKQWVKNCVAIGLSSGFLEPLESTSIHLIQTAIEQLVQRIPDKRPDPRDIDEFNRVLTLKYEDVRDFLILHYCATERDDTPFWNHVRTMKLPDSLIEKMDAFRERGIVPPSVNNIFQEPSWLAVYYGQRVRPGRPHPVATALDSKQLAARLQETRDSIVSNIGSLPDHASFLREMTGKEAAA